jgi:hypothetical protein
MPNKAQKFSDPVVKVLGSPPSLVERFPFAKHNVAGGDVLRWWISLFASGM